MTSETTVESKGARTVCLKTTGHEKVKKFLYVWQAKQMEVK